MLILFIGLLLILTVLWETFETIILPRRVRRRFRLTRLYYRSTWLSWSKVVRFIADKRRREALLSIYGPLSLLGLLAFWATALVLGFALLQHGFGSRLRTEIVPGLAADLYMSGTNFFTLGLGDVTPISWPARWLTVLEAGVGFGFLAIVIGYLPVIYQSFSRREVIVSMLDARAGSPPTALELLKRHIDDNDVAALELLLRDWELWSAELLESHLSYPVLAYFRSQHDNQSWLSALTTILDASAIVMAGSKGGSQRQARLTFAMARHAVVDLSQVFDTRPAVGTIERLDSAGLHRLQLALRATGLESENVVVEKLAHFRQMYEPYVDALARYLQMPLPQWVAGSSGRDNWQTTAWESEQE